MTTDGIEKLPNGWKYVRLKDVCQKITDGTHHSPPNGSEGIPYITAKNIRPFHLDLTELTYVSPKDHTEIYKRCDPKQGDVLYIKDGVTMGIAAVNRLPYEFSMLSSVALIRPNPTLLDSDFLAAWLNTPDTLRSVLAVQSGSAIRRIVLNQIEEIRILLPPLATQKRIAAIAQKADRLRRTRRYAIQLGDTYLQSVFLEMFGRKTSEDLPFVKVESLVKSGKNKIRTGPFGSQLLHSEFIENGQIAVLGIDNVVQNYFTWDKRRFITDRKYQELKRYRVYPGDVLITIMGTCGRCAIAPENLPIAINTKHLCCITLEQTKCLPTYLQACFLRHPLVLKQLGVSERGAVMPGLNMNIIQDVEIPLPPLHLQEKFAQIVQKFERLRTQQREGDRQAEHLFQTLLHRAFRGELTPQHANDEPASVLLKQIGAEQAKAEAEAKAATQAMGDGAEYLGTKAKQQDIEPIQLTIPGIE